MAYPLLLASLAVSAVGAGLQAAGSQQSADAMDRAKQVFNAKQDKLQRDASKVFAKSASQTTRTSTDNTLKEGQAARGQLAQALQQAGAPAATPLPITGTSSYEVTNPGAAASQAAGAATRAQQTGAATRLASYDDWTNQTALNQAEAQRNFVPIQSKSAGNARVFPSQLEAASHAGDALNNWGQIVGAAGSVVGGLGSLVTTPATAAVTPLAQVSQYPLASSMWSGLQSAASSTAARLAMAGLSNTGGLWGTLR